MYLEQAIIRGCYIGSNMIYNVKLMLQTSVWPKFSKAPHLDRLLHRLSVCSSVHLSHIVIPPATKLGGVYWNHPVRPSVCLSVHL